MADLLNRIQPVFAFDFETIFVLGPTRFLRDFGPNGLHARLPGGGADPTVVPGGLSFDGGDYLSLSKSFYNYAPTGPWGWIAVAEFDGSETDHILFDCLVQDGADYFGIGLRAVPSTTPANGYVRAYHSQGDAVAHAVDTQPYVFPTRRTTIVGTVETAPRGATSGYLCSTTTWSTGSYGAPAYSTSPTPRIGISALHADAMIGVIRYLALFDLAKAPLSSAEMLDVCAAGRDHAKPWTERAV